MVYTVLKWCIYFLIVAFGSLLAEKVKNTKDHPKAGVKICSDAKMTKYLTYLFQKRKGVEFLFWFYL